MEKVESRKRTPWDGETDLTETQEFLKRHYETHCADRHRSILKKFLNAHSSFNRDDLQGYLNLFAFVSNPPHALLEKIELIVKTAFDNPKSLRYRDYYSAIPTNSESL